MNMIQSRIKIIFYWALIGVCFILHNLLHLSEIYYGKDMLIANTAGIMPVSVQIFTVLVSIMPFILAVLSLNFFKKGFLWASFVWSILLLCLNAVHFGQTAAEEVFDLAQTVLLLFILVMNLLLSFTLWRSVRSGKDRKQKPSVH